MHQASNVFLGSGEFDHEPQPTPTVHQTELGAVTIDVGLSLTFFVRDEEICRQMAHAFNTAADMLAEDAIDDAVVDAALGALVDHCEPWAE